MDNPSMISEYLRMNIKDYNSTYISDYLIEDVRFYLFRDKENKSFYLSHPLWSNVGMGHSPLQAEQDLISEGQQLYEVLKMEDVREFGYQTNKMFDWLTRISSYKTVRAS